MKIEINTRYWLGDGQYYFIVKPDKYTGEPLAKLYEEGKIDQRWMDMYNEIKPVSMLIVNERSLTELINYFEGVVCTNGETNEFRQRNNNNNKIR